jgi:hypothetical protein
VLIGRADIKDIVQPFDTTTLDFVAGWPDFTKSG